MIDTPREMEDAFERLSLDHGSVRVRLYVDALSNDVGAYVRGIDGSRFEVDHLGRCNPLGNHDVNPFYDDSDLANQRCLSQ